MLYEMRATDAISQKPNRYHQDNFKFLFLVFSWDQKLDGVPL